jgi:holo-[acyl-carrier protein] synthase
MPLSVGIDLVATDEVRASLAAYGERYLDRIYTEGERRECGLDPRRLASRFAAKEATMKALRRDATDRGLSWRSIDVGSDAAGRLRVCLHGPAAEFAGRRRVRRIEVSLSQGAAVAAAVVLAELE